MRRRRKQRANCVCCSTFRFLIFSVRAWVFFWCSPLCHCAIVASLPSLGRSRIRCPVRDSQEQQQHHHHVLLSSVRLTFWNHWRASRIFVTCRLWRVVGCKVGGGEGSPGREQQVDVVWRRGEVGRQAPRGQGSKRLGLPLAAAPLPCSQSRVLSRCRQGSYRHPALHLSMRTPVLSTLFAPRGSERERLDKATMRPVARVR